jgi:hypothetical protein
MINNDSESKFFKDVEPNIQNLKKSLSQINANLEHYGIEPLSAQNGKGSLAQQFERVPQGVGALGPIEDFIRESIRLSDKLSNYDGVSSIYWEIEKTKNWEKAQADLAHGKLERKADRTDMWILWGQKLIRWTAGIIVAVVLYSTVVWVSEKCEFIKIPIKDWIPQAGTGRNE